LDLTRLFSLEFRPVDQNRFPMLRLAKSAMAAGGVAPAIYNAANEVAVSAFLDSRLPFLAIPEIVEQTLEAVPNFEPNELQAVLETDLQARRVATARLRR